MRSDEEIHASVVRATIDVIAESGIAATTTTTVADRAQVGADIVERLFVDRPTLIATTMGWMYGDLAYYVGSRIEAQPKGLPRIRAYIRGMTEYFFDNPSYVQVMATVLGSGELAGQPGERTSTRRWQALADLLTDGQRSGLLGSFDPKAVAIVIGGAIDGLIAEWTSDPTFDLSEGTEELVTFASSLDVGAAFVR